MLILEIAIFILIGYCVLLLILELVAWKVQPDMENSVTLFIEQGGDTIARKLYGFEYKNNLYVSSNHWFRRWYIALLKNPVIEVEREGMKNSYTAVPIKGDELSEISREYKLGFLLRFLCGYAPRRFLRLEPSMSER